MADPTPESAVTAPPKSTPSSVAPVVATAKPVVPTVVTMSEQDSYILSRVANQPSLEDVAHVVSQADGDRHRFSLPDALEPYAYDCSHGKSCKAHPWKLREWVDGDVQRQQWSYGKQGEYVFHWGRKDKRGFDWNINVRGWLVVNKAYFPHIPDHLFSANGAVEVGDSILLFMPAKRALELRRAPGERSRELIKSRMTRVKGGVLMSSSPDDPAVYMPEGGNADDDDTVATPGLMEDRDF